MLAIRVARTLQRGKEDPAVRVKSMNRGDGRNAVVPAPEFFGILLHPPVADDAITIEDGARSVPADFQGLLLRESRWWEITSDSTSPTGGKRPGCRVFALSFRKPSSAARPVF
jgi:hypothetical protein